MVSALAPDRPRLGSGGTPELGTLPMIPTIPTMTMTTTRRAHMCLLLEGEQSPVGFEAEDNRTMSGGGACLWTFRGDLAVGEWTMFGAATGMATRRSWVRRLLTSTSHRGDKDRKCDGMVGDARCSLCRGGRATLD